MLSGSSFSAFKVSWLLVKRGQLPSLTAFHLEMNNATFWISWMLEAPPPLLPSVWILLCKLPITWNRHNQQGCNEYCMSMRDKVRTQEDTINSHLDSWTLATNHKMSYSYSPIFNFQHDLSICTIFYYMRNKHVFTSILEDMRFSLHLNTSILCFIV